VVNRLDIKTLLLLLLVVLVALSLRLYGVNWDNGIGAHPDERYLVGVAESLRWPDRLNPLDVAPHYAYGHVPLYLLALAGSLKQAGSLYLIGRVLSALFDTGTVVLTFALGRRLYGSQASLLSSAFMALMLLHVQQAHFATVDTCLVFFVTAALLSGVRLAECGRLLYGGLAGLWAGMALGTKFSAALLVLPLGVACMISSTETRTRWRYVLTIGAVALATFMLTGPYVLLDYDAYWRNLGEQAAIVQGALDVPYTRQYYGMWPYLYPIVQQVCWGMAGGVGLACFAGLAFAVWHAVQEPPGESELVLLAWVIPAVAFLGALYVKFPRYLMPVTPILAIYGGRLLMTLYRWDHRLGGLAIGSSIVSSFLCCLAFVGLYRVPHPWETASEWFYGNVPKGTTIAVEQWDHPLPLEATGYHLQELPIFDDDTPEKWIHMERIITEADYVVIASRRGYATLARWPERYPQTADYYRRLFEGESDFEAVACFGRFGHLGPIAVVDNPTVGLGYSLPAICQPDAPIVLEIGRLDESFVVYDQPRVIIWRRRS
jgi:4-amino-4-deoxy-L-arabinose transferase-like glycosyltransferase